FVLLTLAAVGCYFALLPTIQAKRFVQRVNAGELGAAEAMLGPSAVEAVDSLQLARRTSLQAGASIEPWTVSDFIRGRRLILLQVSSGEGATGMLSFLTVSGQ